jgi:heme-degrading monooxygenase HmoA
MFAYILRVHAAPDAQAREFFRRFKDTPGLLHAFDLQGVEDAKDAAVVAVWEDQGAAERYLKAAPLRREVDEAYPAITRIMYEVLDAK